MSVIGSCGSCSEICVPLSASDVAALESVANRLEVSVPDAVGLAVRLLAACEGEGCLRRTEGESCELYIVARCRDGWSGPELSRRVFF